MAIAPLTHGWPTIHWWLSLNAAEQAAWAAAVFGLLAAAGGFAAAWASYRAANAALTIADDQAQREAARNARRAELHAAYVFNEMAEFKTHIPNIQAPANAIPSLRGEKSVTQTIGQMLAACRDWQVLLDRIPIDSIAELPESCARHTAAAISSARYVIRLSEAVVRRRRDGIIDLDFAEKAARTIEKKCVEISSNLEKYVAYANATFAYDP